MRVICLNCASEFEKSVSAVKRHPNNFCTRECAGKYNGTRRHGPYNGRTIEQVDEAKRLRQNGASYTEIATAIQVPIHTLAKWVKDVSCPTTPRGNLLRRASLNVKPFEKLISNSAMRKRLIKTRGNQCEECGGSKWNGKTLTLEMHHIDADHSNRAYSNLQLLCPNCHSLTDTYKNKSRSGGTADASGSNPDID